MLKKLTVAALLLLAAAVALVPVVAPGPGATAEGSTARPVTSAATVGGDAAVVELRVWQNVYNAEQLWVSARPEGGSWATLGTIPFPLDAGHSADGSSRYGALTVGVVELRVWQDVSDPLSISITARGEGGDWVDAGRLPLDDGHSPDGRYRYGDLRIVAPLAGARPPVSVSPGGTDVPRLATVTIAFNEPPPVADGAALVSIEPAIEGSFVWDGDRTLLFQPAFPGWQRGERYQVRVHAGAAALAGDHVHAFTVGGRLEVAYVIPGDGDREVPVEAQILVQFNRSVAALTVLQEGPAPEVLEFDPPIAGQGEWLNTSLYRFTPSEELQPNIEYRVRIPAGLSSAAEGVLESDFAWSFATIQPVVSSFKPGDGTKWVEPDSPVAVTFNQPMVRASLEAGLVLREESGPGVAVSLAWSEGDTVVTLTPIEPLRFGASHEIVVPAGTRAVSTGTTKLERVGRFRTIEWPRLERTWPADGQTDAWPGTISLTYNNPMDPESFKGRISISGVAPEHLQVYVYDTYVSLGAPLAHSTAYTVRVTEGVRDRGGRTLPAYEFSFTTRPPPSPPSQPPPQLELAVYGIFVTFSANGPQTLYYRAAHLDEAHFRLYRLSASEHDSMLRDRYVVGGLRGSEDPIREWTDPIKEERRDTWRLHSTALGGGEPLPGGDYLLVANARRLEENGTVTNRRPRALVLSVVDTVIVTKRAHGEFLAWALDYDTGEPVAGLEVQAEGSHWPSPSSRTATTDTDGLARFAIPEGAAGQRAYRYVVVRVDADGRHGVASTRWSQGISQWELGVPVREYVPREEGHVYTDRPIYRPGETVFYKGVVRDENDATYSIPPPAGAYAVRVYSRGGQIHSAEKQLSDLGTIEGSFQLPVTAPTGGYSLTLGPAGVGFTVAAFRTPEFEVDLAAAADHVAGDPIDVEAHARYFFDAPVVDAPVEWAARAWPTSIRVEGYERYSFSNDDYWTTRYRESHRGSARTDDSGIAPFEVPARFEQDEGTQQFTISATVQDTNGQAVANSTTVTVHPATWYAGIKTESYIAKAGEPETVQLVTVDFESRIAPNRPVTVRIYQREWAWRDQDGRYRYGQRDTEIEVLSATTDEAGEASLTFTPPRSGTYRLVAESRDERERVARSARFLWVSGPDYALWGVSDSDVIELIADRNTYEVGDVAEVLVPAPFAGATGLVTIERGRVLSSEVRTFETNSEVLRIPIEDGHIPNVYVGVVLYRPPTADDPLPRYVVGYVKLSVSTAPRRLDVRIEPDREQASPGETVRYEVQVTDAEGRGAVAEVSVAIVDKAVLSLADDVGPDGIGAFWYERALGVDTASSLTVSLDHWNEAYADTEEGALVTRSFAEDEGMDDVIAEPAMDDAAPQPSAEPAPAAANDAGVRSDFQNTALWIGQLTTDEEGKASFELQLPDNATTWRARARAVTAGTQAGEGESELVVTQPLLVRPALPRFLRVGDEVTLRTLVRNGTDAAREVTVTITVEGVTLDGAAARSLTIEPGDSAIFEWPARALEEGTATIRFRAVTSGGDRDAVEISLPVHLDVTPETTATGGVVEEAPVIEAVYLPDYVITDSGSLELSIQGSLVGALHEELKYFAPYPSGWWESNVRKASRVIATIAVQRTQADGLDEAQMRQLNADLAVLVREQQYDGGWGWCKNCSTNLWITGWVLVALGEARDAGHVVPDRALTNTWQLIRSHLNRETDVERPADPNQHAFLLYALASASEHVQEASELTGEQAFAMRVIVNDHRADLTSWGRAYLLLGLIATGHEADHVDVRILLNDLTATTIASANGNHWEAKRIAGSMHNSSVRPTALVLRALTEADPNHPLIEETARWLAIARSSQRWKTNVERAQGMASLGAYAELTGETLGVYDYSVLVNTSRVLAGDFDVPAGDYLDGTEIALAELPLGEVSRVQFERETDAEGRMYYGLNLRYVTPARDIEALNRGFAVSHRYSLLDEPGKAIASASIGDVVRVTVTVVAPADRVFAKVEDLLPAGLEPIDPQLNTVSPGLRERLWADRWEARRRSAASYRRYYTRWDQVDLRDDRLVLRADLLPQGVHEYVYYARATTPGDFFVAPAHAEEAFFPEVFGRSDSGRFSVVAGE